MASKLHKSKEVDLKTYTGIELMYLLQDLMSEFIFRKQNVNNVQSKMDKKISIIYHEIEFGEFTNKEKRDLFDKLKKQLRERRIAKHEAKTVNDFHVIVNANGVYPKLGQTTGHLQKEFHMESQEQVYKQGEFTKFYNKNYLGIEEVEKELEENVK